MSAIGISTIPINKWELLDTLNKDSYSYEEVNIIDNINLIKELSSSSYFPKMFYFNVQIIHKKLYELQEVVKIDNRLQIKDLSFIFYLDLLIENDRDIINYIYDFDFILKIVKFIQEHKYLNSLKQIIISKIILDLIYNFKGFYDGEMKEIIKLEKYTKSIIANNIQFFEEINPNITKEFILEEGIDEIYSEIIISLIKKDKLSEYKYAFDILSKLEIENIDINKLMFKKIEDILNSEENYIIKYKIESKEDLYDSKKINFHYILLKMILKNQAYIYQILFLLKTRLNIIEILKNNNILFKKINEEIERLEYILIKYTDSKYYFVGFENSYKENNKENNLSIKEKKQIKVNQIISYDFNKNTTQTTSKTTSKEKKNDQNEKKRQKNFDEKNYFINQLFEKSIYMLHTSEEEKNFIFDKITFGKNDINIKEKFLQERNNISSKYKNSNFELFIKFLNNFEKKIKIEFTNKYCLNLKLLFEHDKNDIYIKKNNNKNKIYNLNCIITFYDPITKQEILFKLESILENLDNSNSDSLSYLMNEINSDIYENEKYIPPNIIATEEIKTKDDERLNSINEPIKELREEEEKSINNYEEKENGEKSENEASIEQVIIYQQNIDFNSKIKYFECVKEMKYNYFYAYGDKIIDIIDKSYNKKKEILLDEKILNISERISSQNNHVELIACCAKNLNLIKIDINRLEFTVTQYQISNKFCFLCFNIINNTYIISGDSVIKAFENLFTPSWEDTNQIYSNKLYHSGMKLSDTEIILTSNNLMKKGENNLIIINIIKNKVIENIRGYSYVLGPNGIGVMNLNDNKDKLIIAGCKKYFSNQKNGIVLIDYKKDQEKKEIIRHIFYETDNFEVNCICPILDTKNDKKNFFLVGGFDPEIGEGKIKLYQIINNEEGFSSIIYLQDIEFELESKFQGFEMPVSCIKQSSIDGKLLVTSLDHNIYLFSKPNLEFYINR